MVWYNIEIMSLLNTKADSKRPPTRKKYFKIKTISEVLVKRRKGKCKFELRSFWFYTLVRINGWIPILAIRGTNPAKSPPIPCWRYTRWMTSLVVLAFFNGFSVQTKGIKIKQQKMDHQSWIFIKQMVHTRSNFHLAKFQLSYCFYYVKWKSYNGGALNNC